MAFGLGRRFGANDTDKKAYAAVWEAVSTLPEPERCALCSEGIRYHAPCLINLSTGEMDELTVYQPNPAHPGEITPMEQQPTGTFNFQPCAGLMGARDTCSHTCTVMLPEETGLMNPALFCSECRKLLAGVWLDGYAVVDLYDLDHVKAYPVRRGESTVIRDYRVSVGKEHNGILELCVVGLLWNR